MLESDILESDALGDIGCHTQFLADTVHQMECHLRIVDGQRDAGQSPTRPKVHHPSARSELNKLHDTQ